MKSTKWIINRRDFIACEIAYIEKMIEDNNLSEDLQRITPYISRSGFNGGLTIYDRFISLIAQQIILDEILKN